MFHNLLTDDCGNSIFLSDDGTEVLGNPSCMHQSTRYVMSVLWYSTPMSLLCMSSRALPESRLLLPPTTTEAWYRVVFRTILTAFATQMETTSMQINHTILTRTCSFIFSGLKNGFFYRAKSYPMCDSPPPVIIVCGLFRYSIDWLFYEGGFPLLLRLGLISCLLV
jgi:hypothetical protein